MNAAEAAQRLLPHLEPVRECGQGSAPANIALCKYWGKRNEELKLPLTGSLSVSLGPLGTDTTMTRSVETRAARFEDAEDEILIPPVWRHNPPMPPPAGGCSAFWISSAVQALRLRSPPPTPSPPRPDWPAARADLPRWLRP